MDDGQSDYVLEMIYCLSSSSLLLSSLLLSYMIFLIYIYYSVKNWSQKGNISLFSRFHMLVSILSVTLCEMKSPSFISFLCSISPEIVSKSMQMWDAIKSQQQFSYTQRHNNASRLLPPSTLLPPHFHPFKSAERLPRPSRRQRPRLLRTITETGGWTALQVFSDGSSLCSLTEEPSSPSR